MALRTLLYVPGDRPDRVAKAYACEVDGVAIDLEDAVALSAKAAVRGRIADVVRDNWREACVTAVRVNALDTGMTDDDLDALEPAVAALDVVLVPKVSDPEQVEHVADRVARLERAAGADPGRIRLLPIIETARGVLEAARIASAHERVLTLAFGAADLSAELGVTATPDGQEFLHARSHLVMATAAAGREPPLDGVYLRLRDPDGLRRSAVHARSLGFGGKQVIHPEQLQVVRSVFMPSDAEIGWARDVVSAFREAETSGVSSIQLSDGTFVDYPVARRAREILQAAHEVDVDEGSGE